MWYEGRLVESYQLFGDRTYPSQYYTASQAANLADHFWAEHNAPPYEGTENEEISIDSISPTTLRVKPLFLI